MESYFLCIFTMFCINRSSGFTRKRSSLAGKTVGGLYPQSQQFGWENRCIRHKSSKMCHFFMIIF